MTAETENTRYERGIDKLTEVLGQTGLNVVDSLGDMGRYIVEFAYGDVYSRPGLTLRERQMITVALLTVLSGREQQLRLHMKGALNVGTSVRELEEVILQTVPFAGLPTAINAMNILSELKKENE